MTLPYQVEIARHRDGFVLFARPGKRPPPWLELKLMSPGPTIKWRGHSRRIWLLWNADKRRLSDGKYRDQLAQDFPEIYEWVTTVLRALPTELPRLLDDSGDTSQGCLAENGL